jgi:hypothetical protein
MKFWKWVRKSNGKPGLVEQDPVQAKKKSFFVEATAVAALLLTSVGRSREFVEGQVLVHGVWTVQKGTWHSDPNGPEIAPVTGERGYYTYEYLCKDKHNLLVFAGRDWFHNQLYTNTAAGTRGSGFVAVSADAGNPATGDTTLTGEITTGGLARADADTKQHVNGTNLTTIEHTFTASAQHTGVRRVMLFNAASGGTGSHSNTFTAANLEINDTLKVTGLLTLA